MVLNATFNNISVISVSFIGGGPGVSEKITNMPHVTDNLDHIMI